MFNKLNCRLVRCCMRAVSRHILRRTCYTVDRVLDIAVLIGLEL